MGDKKEYIHKDISGGLTEAKARLKSIKIKHHHAKPYRKRHVASLFITAVTCAVLFGLAYYYNDQLKSGLQSAKEFIVGKSTQIVEHQTVESTFGFSITYDPRQLYASGLDASTGELFIGNELGVNRAYEVVRLAPTLGGVSTDAGNMTIHFYNKNTVTNQEDLASVESAAIKELTAKATVVAKKTGTANVELGGKKFLKTDWLFQSDNRVFAGLTPSFTTYSGVLNGKALVVQVMNGSIANQNTVLYENVIASLYFGPSKVTDVSMPSTAKVAQKAAESRTLLESLLLGQIAAAQGSANDTSSQIISAQYGPAVVKIFNVYCQDILYDGKLLIKDACSGGTGSGFFISKDGYIASNGHVTSSDPKDILMQFAYSYYRKGDMRLLDFLAAQAKITAADLPIGSTQERADFLFDRLYGIGEGHISTQNSAVNLLVTLGKEQPDVKELINVTNKRQQYSEQATIKRAQKVGQDFRSIDGFAKFHASDVSIIKIEGTNYPVTKLGNITTLMQGANLNILGFPGNAANNGIVDAGESTVTLTSGKVSSIKNALGSTNKLIETDTLIGHGNSGGPAFNDSGEVVGISTYTATKVDDGTYNYVRDIKDLIDLASDSSVALSSQSPTQIEWESALESFNTAHYSKAVKGFATVKKLYPSHPKVEEFIAAANENIRQGKDVKDFPILVVGIVGAVFLVSAAVSVVLIVRHKKAHNVYKTHVGEGKMEPLNRGDQPQQVMYDPAHVSAQANVHTMERHIPTPNTHES